MDLLLDKYSLKINNNQTTINLSDEQYYMIKRLINISNNYKINNIIIKDKYKQINLEINQMKIEIIFTLKYFEFNIKQNEKLNSFDKYIPSKGVYYNNGNFIEIYAINNIIWFVNNYDDKNNFYKFPYFDENNQLKLQIDYNYIDLYNINKKYINYFEEKISDDMYYKIKKYINNIGVIL